MAEVLYSKDGRTFCCQRNRFFEGEKLEVLQRGVEPYEVTITDLRDDNGEKIDKAPHPMMTVSFESDKDIPAQALLRKAV
jgi:putative protease